MPDDQCIDYILKSQPDDPRLKKWEYKIILDTLQELENADIPTLLKTINTNHQELHGCKNELFNYNKLYSYLNVLLSENVILTDKNFSVRTYSVSPNYSTVKLKYLPISNYCVYIFSISVLLLLYSTYINYMTTTTTQIVMVGAVYILGQMIGTEFDYKKIMQTINKK